MPPRSAGRTPPLLSELTWIGQRLDQIARHQGAGSDGALAEEVRTALDRHWTLVRRVLQDRRQGRARVPSVIAATSSGRRFATLAQYLLHGRSGEETERVAWTAGRNLGTDDPELAAELPHNRTTAFQRTAKTSSCVLRGLARRSSLRHP